MRELSQLLAFFDLASADAQLTFTSFQFRGTDKDRQRGTVARCRLPESKGPLSMLSSKEGFIPLSDPRRNDFIASRFDDFPKKNVFGWIR